MVTPVHRVLILHCVVLLHSTIAARHIVTSISQLSQLVNFERDLLYLSRKFRLDMPQKFLNFLSSVEAEYSKQSQTNYISLPIHQYRLVRRFTYDWNFWKSFSANRVPNFLNTYEELSLMYNGIDQFPTTDFVIAAYSFSYVHLFYGNNRKQLPSMESNDYLGLTQSEMLELAVTTFNNIINPEDDEEDNIGDGNNEEEHSIEGSNELIAQYWLKQFLDNTVKILPFSSAKHRIAYILKHRDTYGSKEILSQAKTLESLDRIRILMEKYPNDFYGFYDFIMKNSLTRVCQSFDRSNGSLHCLLFKSPTSPYSPFKYEILSLWPYVAIVHNFLPTGMAQQFINSALSSGLHVTEVLENNGTSRKDLSVRLSEAASIHPQTSESLWLDRRIFEATRLSPNSRTNGPQDGEPAQILNYGIGGFYWPHHDYLKMNSSDNSMVPWGDRLATVLVYLSTVESGGNTAFPKLGVGVAPRAGRALVWFNLDPRNGTPLNLTEHAACPMNQGSKWVLNKWIRTHGKISDFTLIL